MMADKPSLQEIANMPFPASEQALKEHYGVEPWHDKSQDKRGVYEVRVEWSFYERVTDSEVFEIEADNEDEAIRLAEERCAEENLYETNFEVEESEVVGAPA